MPLKDRGTTMGMYKESLEAFIALLTYAYRSIWLHRALTLTHTCNPHKKEYKVKF